MMRFRFHIAAVLVGLAAPVYAAQAINEHHASIDPKVSVKIEDVISGKVRVIGWDKKEFHIEGEVGADVEKLVVDVDRDRIRVKPQYRSEDAHAVDVDLTLHVPEGARFSLECVSAVTDVEGVKGRVEVQSVSGDMTVSGPADVMRLQCVSGEIKVTHPGRDIEIQSVSGDLDVRGDSESVSISSVSGDVAYEGRPKHLEASVVSGDVRVGLPAGIRMDVEVTTFSGRIDNDFGVVANESKQGPGRTLAFKTGSDAEIEISSVTGKVMLIKTLK